MGVWAAHSGPLGTGICDSILGVYSTKRSVYTIDEVWRSVSLLKGGHRSSITEADTLGLGGQNIPEKRSM